MKVPKELKEAAKQLPPLTFLQPNGTGTTVNHKRRMKKMLKAHGIAGVNSYIKAVYNHVGQ